MPPHLRFNRIQFIVRMQSIKEQTKTNTMEKEEYVCYHGQLSEGRNWKQPKLIASSNELSRPGYSPIKANEFQDQPETLREKIALLAILINEAKNCVVYTGAGISRASGIADYATKAVKSIAGSENHSLNRLMAEPSLAHHILAQLQRRGKIHHWIQQNHDGLAQKAGFPLSKLNQIHGSWFDKKNSVVLMDDSLNPKNFKLLQQWQQKVDLCLALGTSLCGMRSDGVAARAAKQGKLVIINLQQTPYDQMCHLRLYGNLQTILQLMAKQMSLKLTKKVVLHKPMEWKK